MLALGSSLQCILTTLFRWNVFNSMSMSTGNPRGTSLYCYGPIKGIYLNLQKKFLCHMLNSGFPYTCQRKVLEWRKKVCKYSAQMAKCKNRVSKVRPRDTSKIHSKIRITFRKYLVHRLFYIKSSNWLSKQISVC